MKLAPFCVLMCTTALMSQAAFAQEAGGSPENAVGSQGGVQEIIVSAQRRDQSLQEVPIAVTALSSQALETNQIETVGDLPNLAPSLVVNTFGNAMVLFIRGVGSLDGSPGQESAVALYVDGVYRAAPFAANQQLSNIERVEVLKGPQGTLFGRNATGGAVQIITKKPSAVTKADFSVGFGNYDTVTAKGYVTTGLGDGVAADLAFAYSDRGNGWGVNLATNREIYRKQNWIVRSRWNFQISDNLELDLTGEYMRDRSNNDVRTPVPGATLLDGTTFENFGGGFYDTRAGLDPHAVVKGGSGSATLNYDASSFRIKSITALTKYVSASQFDQEGTVLPILDVFLDAKFRTFTQEVQVMSDPASKVQWIGGLFYMNDRSGFLGGNGLNLFGIGMDADPTDSQPFGNVGIFSGIKTESYSAFAEMTYPFGDSTRLTVGGRYSIDKRKSISETRVLDPSGGLDRDAAILLTLPNPNAKVKYKKATWRAILDHDIGPDSMIYASVSRGFKAGNFNAVSPTTEPFRPETITAYEAGIKSDLFGRKLRLNLSAYYYDYKDLQLSAVQGPTLVTQNAASAELAGLEIEGVFAPGGGFEIAFNGAYAWSQFKDYPDGILYEPVSAGGSLTIAPFDHSGERMPKSPKLAFTISPRYTIPMKSGDLTLSASWNHSSRYRFEASSLIFQPKSDLVMARIAYETKSGLGISVWARNILKEKLYQYAFGQALGNAYFAAEPRTYGAELSYSF